jgi:hypothetical protein
VQTVFGTDERMFSADIVAALIDDPEWEWSDLGRGKSLTQAGLAKQLKLYGIRSQNVRIGEGHAKGYTADGEDGLAQAWDRYLPSTCSRPKRPKGVPPETPSEQPLFDTGTAGTAGTHTDGSAERNGQTPSGSKHRAVPVDAMSAAGTSRHTAPGVGRCGLTWPTGVGCLGTEFILSARASGAPQL